MKRKCGVEEVAARARDQQEDRQAWSPKLQLVEAPVGQVLHRTDVGRRVGDFKRSARQQATINIDRNQGSEREKSVPPDPG